MWFVAICFVVIFLLLILLDTKKPSNYPPGPRWLPIVGSMFTLKKLRDETGYLYKATKALADVYGPVIGLRVGKDRQVVCCGYNAIREMLSNEDFDGRPRGPFYETRTWGTRRGLLLTDEEFWQEQRRFVMRHLREFGFGKKTMSELVQQEAEQLVRLFEEKLAAAAKVGEEGVVVPMRDIFSVYVLNTLWSMLASIRYSPQDGQLKTLQSLLTELFASIDMVGALFSQFPFLRYVAPQKSGYKQFISIHQRVWAFLKAELDSHKETFESQSPRDLMDVYLQMLNSKDKTFSFSESQLLAICMDMFMAGSETTSKSLGFGFLYMLLNPHVQKEAREEIDRVIGGRAPTLNDRPNMPYVESLVLESVRVFMGRTFSIPHRARRDTTLQGYHIPKDTMVIANFTAVLMDKEFWKDPEAFRPNRFIDNKTNKVVVPDQYLPFGMGKHKCMGQALARSNIFLFMASLLQKFEFSVVPGEAAPRTDGVDGVTPSPGEFNAYVTYRSNPNLRGEIAN